MHLQDDMVDVVYETAVQYPVLTTPASHWHDYSLAQLSLYDAQQ